MFREMTHLITMVIAVLAMLTTIFAQWGYGFYPGYGYPMYGGGFGGWGGGYNPIQGAVEGAVLGGMLGAMEGK
ncbi:hypothetical protein OSTOST_10032 [Ostertagia ostertagi]